MNKKSTGHPWVLPLCLLFFLPRYTYSDTLVVAVAANFKSTLETLQNTFEKQTPHRLKIASASTGALYAQILNGAPFDIFLAADEERPRLLAQHPVAAAGSRFTYATGILAWVDTHPTATKKHKHTRQAMEAPIPLCQNLAFLLRQAASNRDHIAVANPKTAPYGAAAKQLLQQQALWDTLGNRLLQGSNITQTFQFIYSGNARYGLVALSQIVAKPRLWRVCRVPDRLHAPLHQQAIMLKRAADKPAAIEFLRFLRSPLAKQLIVASGYHLSDR